LGVKYALGEGVPQDFAKAAKWIRKAADQGNEYAQNSMGGMYERGEGVPKNKTEAAKWYRKAAEQGDADAKRWLEKNDK
jgi:TPR repeat protein